MFNKATQFLREAYGELIRVTWPSKSQTIQYTTLVVIISVLVAIFLGILDYFFGMGITDIILPSVDTSGALPLDTLNLNDLAGDGEFEVNAETTEAAEPTIEVVDDTATDADTAEAEESAQEPVVTEGE